MTINELAEVYASGAERKYGNVFCEATSEAFFDGWNACAKFIFEESFYENSNFDGWDIPDVLEYIRNGYDRNLSGKVDQIHPKIPLMSGCRRP